MLIIKQSGKINSNSLYSCRYPFPWLSSTKYGRLTIFSSQSFCITHINKMPDTSSSTFEINLCDCITRAKRRWLFLFHDINYLKLQWIDQASDLSNLNWQFDQCLFGPKKELSKQRMIIPTHILLQNHSFIYCLTIFKDQT